MHGVELTGDIDKNKLPSRFGRLKVLLLVNFFTLIVVCMTYKPPKLDALDESGYVYMGVGKNLLLLVYFASVLLYIAKGSIPSSKVWSFRFKFLWIPIPFFCCFIAVSGLWNLSPIFSDASVGVALFNLVQFLSVCILFHFVDSRRRVRYLALFLGNLSFVLTLFAVPESLGAPFGTRLASLAGDSTAFGSFSALGFLSVFYLNSIRKKKLFLLSALQVAFLLMTVLSGSRNALMSLCLAGAVYVVSSGRANFSARFRITSLLKTLVIGFAALSATAVTVYRGFSGLFSRGDSVEASRTFIWGIIYLLYVQSSGFNKVFGNGFGFLKENFRSAHNTYLQIMIEYGAFFLVLLFCYFYYVFKCLSRYEAVDASNSEQAFLLSLLVFVFVFSFSLNVLFIGVFSICYLVLCSITAILILNRVRGGAEQSHSLERVS